MPTAEDPLRTQIRLSFVFLLFYVPLAFSQQSPPATQLSEIDVATAIQDGLSKKELKPFRIGRRAKLIKSAMAVEIGQAYTPYLRVALAARAARDSYKAFAESDVTPDMVEPLVYVQVPPQERVGATTPLDQYVDVETVLVLPKGSKDPAQAIRPIWLKESVTVFTNLFGVQWQTKGMVAAFPMETLSPAYEFVAIYKEKPTMGGGTSGKEIRGTNVDGPSK